MQKYSINYKPNPRTHKNNTNHDQVYFIPKMTVYFKYMKINKCLPPYEQSERINHMIISLDLEKAIDINNSHS